MITVPKVVITTTAGMNCGFSRDLFTEWASNPDNLILFTSKNPESTLARKITDRIDDSSLSEISVHVRNWMNELNLILLFLLFLFLFLASKEGTFTRGRIEKVSKG